MGKVMTKLKLTNPLDLEKVRMGLLLADQVRAVEVEALVDTGATTLVLPTEIVARLGLVERRRIKVRYANGQVAEVPLVGGVLIEILGRDMTCDALVEAAGTTPLIGQIPLEQLDLVVDPRSRDVHVNPASPDMPMLEILTQHAA